MNDKTRKYVCILCNYSTNRNSSYEKHLYTWKHIHNEQTSHESLKTGLTCHKCGKGFKKRCWYIRHIDKCSVEETPTDDDNTVYDKSKNCILPKEDILSSDMTQELLMTMMKYVRVSEKKHDEHMEMMQKQLEEERNQCKALMSTVKDMIPRIGNFNNNKISINIFLQEHCKDALNLKDFVDSLRIELGDVSKYQDRSMIDAVGNVFVNGLRQLDLYKRPIHCMDLSRETLYIKDDGAWENDTINKNKLSGAISAVAAKQSKVLKEWEKLHPDWSKSDKLTAEYLRLVRATTCPIERGSVSENRIIHNIAKEVVVDLRKIQT